MRGLRTRDAWLALRDDRSARATVNFMPFLQLIESWAEGLLRIAIGAGLGWIGSVERGGYGLFLTIVGGIFVVAGIAEIWSVETAARRAAPRASTRYRAALVPCDIPVFYATTHGQTRRIAERLAAMFREKGFISRATDIASDDASHVNWGCARAVVVTASLHAHKHQRVATVFCREHARDLNVRPSVFLSVSLAVASEDGRERSEAARIAREFVTTTGWRAGEVTCLAGRLAYTQYGWLTRFVMKRIARQHGQPTDTTRDYEFTNWDEVARVADDVVQRIAAEQARRVA
jgi:menaquinone-dependent protoporphyrinogen oxidase